MANNQNKSDDKRHQDNLSEEQRQKTGSLGGQARRDEGADYSEMGQMQGKQDNPGNFANRPKKEVKEAATEGGKQSRRDD